MTRHSPTHGSRQRLDEVLFAPSEQCRHRRWTSADGRARVVRNANGTFGAVPGDGTTLATLDPDDVARRLVLAGTYPGQAE